MLGTTRVLLVAAIVAVMTLALAAPAQAHALLGETNPTEEAIVEESPEQVIATFNEPVEIAFGALRVYDTEAKRVDRGESSHPNGDPASVAIALEPGLPDGTYTVTYRVVSADGHPIQGAFVFHVGRPGARPQGIGETLLSGEGGSGPVEQALYGVARWSLFAGITTIVGAFAFVTLVWSRKQSDADLPADVRERFGARWRKLAVTGWMLTMAATLAGFVLQGAVAADVSAVEALSPSIGTELLKTRYGSIAVVRFVVLLVLAGAWMAAGRTSVVRSNLPMRHGSTVGAAAITAPARHWSTGVVGVLLAILAATPALSGHAGATDPVWLNIPVDGLHVAAAGVWIGGLITLIACAYRARPSDPARSLEIMGPVVSRFSDVALVAVGVLVATGAYRTWVEVQALRAFVEAPYGWVLLTKLLVFLPLLALGAVNNRMLKPRIDKAMDSGAADDSALKTLRRLVGVEVALGVIVLAITALLVNLPPARVDAGVTGPFIDKVALGDNNLDILVDPNEIGENEVHLTVTTSSGTAAEIQAMKVRFVMPEQDIGPLIGKGTELGPGHFVVQGHQLSVAGEWILEVEARIDKFTNLHAEVKVTVNE
jgi:copper transport protein